jgi:SAM-dependent methyltransferase
MIDKTLNEQYWEQRYQNNDTPWDIGYPSPAFVDFMSKVDFKTKSILIPGAGNAYEAHWLLEHGATDVTVVDISQLVVAKLKKEVGDSGVIKVINLDFFKLEGQFDYIFEQTFFCALQPQLRKDYVAKMNSLLSANGMLFGLLFNTVFDRQGPPFGGDSNEYFELFSPVFTYFEVDYHPLSIPPRINSEIFFKTYNHSIN